MVPCLLHWFAENKIALGWMQDAVSEFTNNLLSNLLSPSDRLGSFLLLPLWSIILQYVYGDLKATLTCSKCRVRAPTRILI